MHRLHFLHTVLVDTAVLGRARALASVFVPHIVGPGDGTRVCYEAEPAKTLSVGILPLAAVNRETEPDVVDTIRFQTRNVGTAPG